MIGEVAEVVKAVHSCGLIGPTNRYPDLSGRYGDFGLSHVNIVCAST